MRLFRDVMRSFRDIGRTWLFQTNLNLAYLKIKFKK